MPFAVAPSGQVHAVGHASDVVFLGEIARPQALEHFTGNTSVDFAHAVHLLAEVGGQNAHRELFVGVVGIEATQPHKAFPANIHSVSIVRHVSTNQVFLKRIVTRRHGRVCGEQGRGSDQLKRNVEVEIVLVDIHAQTFQSAEGRVSLVAMVNRWFQADGFEQTDTAHAEEHLLLDAHFAVAAVKSARDATVFRRVLIDVSIKQIQPYPTHIDTPNFGKDRAAREGDADLHPVAVVVADGCQRQLRELLRDVVGALLARHGDFLGEVTVTIQQTDAHHVGVAVGGLFHVVAGEDA